jgi:tetratricopeptide (TPR) repeat protein
MKFVLTCILFLTILIKVFAQSSSEALLLEANENISKGKYGEAIELLNRYISANPQKPEGFNLRGTCFEKRGEYEKAVYDYRSALKLDSKSSVYQTNLSRTTEEFNSVLYNTIAGYKREIVIDPSEAKNYLEVGKSYKKLGNWKTAEEWYDYYLLREEASADEILRYTEILAKNNHISKGEPILKQYTQKYPDDHRLWSRYGYFTMWLRKKKTALKAFENALELRPYFKEAMDGYDMVRGKGYVYTVNDTTTRYNYGLPPPKRYKQYPIDRYYRKLKKNPGDITTRYLLVDELVKNNRFEEADEQLNVLSETQSKDSKFRMVEAEVMGKRIEYYENKISTLERKLSFNPNDRKTVLELGKYYSSREQYAKAIRLYDDYLLNYYSDFEVRYQKVRLLSQAGNLDDARNEMEVILNQAPNNKNYQLLYGQLLVWLDEDLDVAEENLNNVLNNDPRNLDALITLANLNFQKNDLASAEMYVNKGFKIDPQNNDIMQVERSINLQKKINEESKIYGLLNQAREYSFKKQCNKAIDYYNMYFSESIANPYLKKELAEAYMCDNNYDAAIKIYNELVLKYPDDYDLAKQLAKIYYWSGDSLAALYQFEKLTAKNPDDAETKLFLGDTYMKVGDYKNAREVYEELLVISPSSHILQTRIGWLGSAGLTGYSANSFPTHFSIIPDGNYFGDNLDFTYTTQGVKLELGVTSYLSLAGSGYFGFVSSEQTRLNLNILRADAYLRFSDIVIGSVAYGTTNFENDENTYNFEVSVRAAKQKKYNISASFYSADAVQILYSPFLVDVRLTANYTLFVGEFITKDGVLLRADAAYIAVSDANRGSKVILRIGKIFDEAFGIGYEYYYYNFNEQTLLYWSPSNFESHSIWADWDAIDDTDFLLSLKGKLGLIPNENFIVRELHTNMSYKFNSNFVMQARLSFGSSVRVSQGYNSISFGLSAYWTL